MAKRFATKEAALNFIDTLPINTIRNMLADYLISGSAPVARVTLTEEQFKQFFKIRGVGQDGSVEPRGRKKKVSGE